MKIKKALGARQAEMQLSRETWPAGYSGRGAHHTVEGVGPRVSSPQLLAGGA